MQTIILATIDREADRLIAAHHGDALRAMPTLEATFPSVHPDVIAERLVAALITYEVD